MSIITEKETAMLMQNIGVTLANYLSVAMGAIDLLTKKFEESDDTEVLEYLAMARHSQFEVLNIVDNMRELGTDVLGETYLQLNTVNINDLCFKLINSIKKYINDKGINLVYNPDPNEITLTADYARIERMLIGLFANSISHCDSGDSIQLSVSSDDEKVYLVLSDNGEGINDQTLPILFDDYLREIENYDANKGAGLGMSVCESIARQHGGSIIVTSAAGTGTSVSVSLPKVYKAFLGMATNGQYGNLKEWSILTGLSTVLSHKKYIHSAR